MIYKRRIFGFECDIYGHLNNANYLHIYEEARAIALEEMDFSVSKLRESGIHIYLVKIELDFLKAVGLEELITVETKMKEANRLKAIWSQKIYNNHQELCNEAMVYGVFVKNGKPFRLPNEMYLDMIRKMK